MRFGLAVQTKGLGWSLFSATKRMIAASSSSTDRNTPRLRRRLVSLAKKPSTALSQDARGGCEVECPAGMPGQPFLYLRMLVGRIVVDDGVDRLSCRHLRLDGGEKADELLVPVAVHVAADDGAVEDVEGSKQCRRTVALVIVGHSPGTALLHRQTRLGAVERLDLALLINREDNGVSGRIDIETDDVPELFGKFRVVRQLERPDTVRREPMGFENALHRTQAHPDRLGQLPAGPLGSLPKRGPPPQVDL